MATANSIIGAELVLGSDATVTVFEGDIIENMVYKSGNTTKTISGAIRVINATTKTCSTVPKSCPPEPYVHKYITIQSLTIDSSEVFDAEMNQISVADIINIGSINGNKLAIQVDGQIYSDVAEALANLSDGSVITLMEDINKVLEIPAGISCQINALEGITVYGGISIPATGAHDVTITVNNVSFDGSNNNTGFGILSQNQTENDQMNLNLICNTVTFKNFSKKGIYATNAKTLELINCTFQDAACGEMNDPNTKGDYAVDLNLVAVQNAVIKIQSCLFKGACGKKSNIKVAQRGGPSDEKATDIPKTVGMATVESMLVSSCSFANTEAAADVTIGTDNKSGGTTANNSGAYPCTIGPNLSATVILMKYNASEEDPDGNSMILAAGMTATKTADSDMQLVRSK